MNMRISKKLKAEMVVALTEGLKYLSKEPRGEGLGYKRANICGAISKARQSGLCSKEGYFKVTQVIAHRLSRYGDIAYATEWLLRRGYVKQGSGRGQIKGYWDTNKKIQAWRRAWMLSLIQELQGTQQEFSA
jgi:hypothetical protein